MYVCNPAVPISGPKARTGNGTGTSTRAGTVAGTYAGTSTRTNTGTNPPRPKPPKTAGAPAALMINGCTTLDIDVHVGVSWLFGSQGITAST